MKKVLLINTETKTVKKFNSSKCAAKYLDIDKSHISNSIKNKAFIQNIYKVEFV